MNQLSELEANDYHVKLLVKIGKIVVGYESLTLILRGTVSRLISTDSKIGSATIAEHSFKNLINVFSSLMKLKFPDQYQNEVDEIIKGLFQSDEMRNTTLHSSYAFFGEGNPTLNTRMKTTAKAKKGLHTDKEEINDESFSETIKKIGDTTKLLGALYNILFPNEILSWG